MKSMIDYALVDSEKNVLHTFRFSMSEGLKKNYVQTYNIFL